MAAASPSSSTNPSFFKVATLKGHEDSVTCVDWTETAPALILSGSQDKTVKVWDIRDKKANIQTYDFGKSGSITSIKMKSDTIFVATSDCKVHKMDMRMTDQSQMSHQYVDEISCMRIGKKDNDGSDILIIGDDSGRVTQMNTNSNTILSEQIVHKNAIVCDMSVDAESEWGWSVGTDITLMQWQLCAKCVQANSDENEKKQQNTSNASNKKNAKHSTKKKDRKLLKQHSITEMLEKYGENNSSNSASINPPYGYSMDGLRINNSSNSNDGNHSDSSNHLLSLALGNGDVILKCFNSNYQHNACTVVNAYHSAVCSIKFARFREDMFVSIGTNKEITMWGWKIEEKEKTKEIKVKPVIKSQCNNKVNDMITTNISGAKIILADVSNDVALLNW
ncbi:WD repeat domain-containing protein 83 [Reticulomyxa filosa]|uniref:WD repeat domain-containing protein 83 n=1 Tax=Reticulomyxa filosa TaxID=46433 RepID=X6P8J8_RETFI|nr:WD repeat domain-containing protein 83 [Reticulomyxa filosa]|eukprot:ETO33972.1 WD repeat domain-containing protein 83 [Reticulomyxa filosa]